MMTATELNGWLDILKSQAGVIAILCGILYALKKRWWVPGWVFDAEVQRGKEYKLMAYHVMGITKKMLEPGSEADLWRAP